MYARKLKPRHRFDVTIPPLLKTCPRSSLCFSLFHTSLYSKLFSSNTLQPNPNYLVSLPRPYGRLERVVAASADVSPPSLETMSGLSSPSSWLTLQTHQRSVNVSLHSIKHLAWWFKEENCRGGSKTPTLISPLFRFHLAQRQSVSRSLADPPTRFC